MPDSFIYFVQGGEFIKIGTTTNVRARLSSIGTHTPFPIQLLCTLPGGPKTEARIHRRFEEFHAHGEWFRDVPEIRSYIESPVLEDQIPESGPYLLAVNCKPPAWFASLLAEHNINLLQLKELSSIYPETVCRWASDMRLYSSISVSGKVAKALGLKEKELSAMRERALAYLKEEE